MTDSDVPQRVPESRPTPLQSVFIELSLVALVCGTVAITAYELGQPLASPIVRLSVLLGAGLLMPVTIDAAVRVARSVRAWWPVDQRRAVFRLVWVAALVIGLAVEIGAAWLVVAA